MRTKIFIFALLGSIGLFSGCNGRTESAGPLMRRADSMNIEEVVVHLPEGNGKELVEMYCVPCHSLRYIEMQPDMPKKSWEKIVTKMIKMYGAPVRDSVTESAIVEYLAEVKGE